MTNEERDADSSRQPQSGAVAVKSSKTIQLGPAGQSDNGGTRMLATVAPASSSRPLAVSAVHANGPLAVKGGTNAAFKNSKDIDLRDEFEHKMRFFWAFSS